MGLPHVMVEIADPEAFEATQLSPVHCTDTVFAVWDALREAILQVIDLTGVRILGCYRFGRSSTAHHNPPTVVVIVDFKSTRTWKTTREQIVDILNRIMLPSVAVAVIKDRIRRATFSPEADFTRKVFSSPVLPGQGLGPSDQDQVTGAFGGYVELKFPDGEWHTYGLTCFHCVVPGERYLSQSNPEVRKSKCFESQR
ncbi:hypothetical protein BDW59DRAFT_146585 [Aspergillus cavernicola]|uniref:Tautomerase cis-CaaD-like domain-containing protein n=1 Tax=Aspergillus cavernicola TaxID=176166 RepID=A0ABR4ID34_9EURO